MILTITLNPAVDRTLYINDLAIDHINRIQATRRDIGGKGINVSKTIRALGDKSIALAILGGANGEFIRTEAQRIGLDLDVISITGNTRENIKIVDQAHNTFTDLNETGPNSDPDTLIKIKHKIQSILCADDILVISGSLLPDMPTDLYADIILAAKTCGASVILDIDGTPLKQALKSKPHYIKPNRHELEGLFQKPLPSIDSIQEHAELLLLEGIENVIVSLGAEGLLWISAGGTYRAQALKVPVKSTVGAGDALVAAIAHGLNHHMTTQEIITLAVATASCVIETEGSQSGSLASLKTYKQAVQIKLLGGNP